MSKSGDAQISSIHSFLNPEVAARYSKGVQDPASIDGGALHFQAHNYFEIPANQDQEKRLDEMFEHNAAILKDEIGAIVDREITFDEPLDEAEKWRRISKIKSELIFTSLVTAIGEYVGKFIVHNQPSDPQAAGANENTATWEDHLRQDVYTKTLGDRQKIVEFAFALYRAVFYSSRNFDLSVKSEDERRDNFEKIKGIADLENCIGGGHSGLETIYYNARFPGFAWNEIKEKTALDLKKCCLPGNHSHLPSWLEFALYGNLGGDENLFSPAADIMMEDVRRVLETFTLRNGAFVTDFFTKKIVEIVRDVEEIMKVESQKPENQGRSKDEEQYAIYEILKSALKTHQYSAIREVEAADVMPMFDTEDGEDKNASNQRKYLIAKSALRKIIQGDSLSEARERRHSFDNPETVNFINIINMINTYTAKNMEIPLWLRDQATQAFAVNIRAAATAAAKETTDEESDSEMDEEQFQKRQDQKRQDQKERLFTKALEKTAEAISSDLKIPLTILKKSDSARSVPVVRCKTIVFAEGRGHAHNIQSIFDAGGNVDDILSSLGAEHFPPILSIKGILFHPKQDAIIVALKQKGVTFDVGEAIEAAIITGDSNLLINLCEHFPAIAHEWERYGSQLNLEYPSGRPLQRMTLAHFDSLFQSLNHAVSLGKISQAAIHETFRAMFYTYILLEDGAPHIIISDLTNSNEDKKGLFKWIQENLGNDFFVNHIAAAMPSAYMETLLRADSSNELSELFHDTLDEVYRHADEEGKARLTGLHKVVATIFSNLSQMDKAMSLWQNAAENGDLDSTNWLGYYSLTGERGAKKDSVAALEFFELVRDNDNASPTQKIIACFHLSNLHSEPRDDFTRSLSVAREYLEELLALAEDEIIEIGSFVEGLINQGRINFIRICAELAESREEERDLEDIEELEENPRIKRPRPEVTATEEEQLSGDSNKDAAKKSGDSSDGRS